MSRDAYIKIKAAFLTVVFALNTVVGFACSIGIDMGFNSTHHSLGEAAEAVVHLHKDGKRHLHQEKKEGHSHNKQHKHDLSRNPHQPEGKKGDCCTNEVKQFQDVDKSVPNSSILVHPVFFTAFLASYYQFKILSYTDVVKDVKPFVRSYHPPIPDIRIAIQSFQI